MAKVYSKGSTVGSDIVLKSEIFILFFGGWNVVLGFGQSSDNSTIGPLVKFYPILM